MKGRVSFHRLAERDLNDIYDFIARDNRIAAMRYAKRIEAHCLTLSTFAERGPIRPELAPGVRILPLDRRVVIAYRIVDQAIIVLRILYGGRDFPEEWPED